MYEEFYGLTAAPFSITPDPRYLYFTRRHREAFDHMLFGITERKGFVQITGEVGAGKSTLCRAVLERLGEGYATALIFNPALSGIQLLRAILVELGLPDGGNDRLRLMQRLNEFLLQRAHEDRDVVLFIDEAQDLSLALLEQIRLLSNLETDDRKLLQIVLVGQPELRGRMRRPELRQLRQRITVRYHLGPIERGETESYIQHRLAVAGANGRPTFSRAAIRAIYWRSRGVPRLINAICDKTLLAGYVEGRDALGLRQVWRAVRELRGEVGVSLVSEALRKARAEAAAREAERRGANLSTTYVSPPRRPRPGGGLLIAAGVVAGAALAGAAVAWWALAHQDPRREATPGGRRAAPPPAAAVVADSTRARTAPAAAAPDASRTPAAAGTATASRSDGLTAPSASASPTVPAAAVPPARESARPTAPPVPGGVAAREAPSERVFVLDANLGYARLHLDFLVYKPSAPFGRVNGQDIVPGSIVDGFLVEAIERDSIRLSDDRGPVILRVR